MPKILFVAPHRPDRSPSQRFRFEQYLEYLQSQGFDYDFSYLISAEDDQKLYKKGKYNDKLKILLKSHRIRKGNVQNAHVYDIIFVQREAFMTRSIKYEKAFARSKAKLVFDFDDSIWLQNVSSANKNLNWLKNPHKTSKIIELADLVIAGNKYLKEYADRFNDQTMIIPTTIDTTEYQRIDQDNDKVCIGWSGSITTIQHFEYALPFLRKVKAKFGGKVTFKVIGDGNYRNEELDIQGIAWNKQDEIKELSSFDIGIMPLPDDEWAKGKCGLKGLQYMALEIPTIMSPVGVNQEIIAHGKNGFLAKEADEWLTIIGDLIKDKALRNKVGKAARKTVVDHYSVESNKEKYLCAFQDLLKSTK